MEIVDCMNAYQGSDQFKKLMNLRLFKSLVINAYQIKEEIKI